MGPLIADGGLATTLQARGLPPCTPVDDWLLRRPADVEAVHRDFVEAGARLILAGTFRALPPLRDDWRALTDAAVGLARRAAGGAAVYASVGPTWAPGDDPAADGYRLLAAHLEGAVDGIVLETFVDPDALAAALEAMSAVGVPIVASLVVTSEGTLMDGRPARPALARLRTLGASAVGLNCGGSQGVRRALQGWEDGPVWARPGRDGETIEAWVEAVSSIADRCAVIGGCCGVPPSAIRQLAARASS